MVGSFVLKDPNLDVNNNDATTEAVANERSYTSLGESTIRSTMNPSCGSKSDVEEGIWSTKDPPHLVSEVNTQPDAVLEGGPWMIRNSPIILKKWSMNTSLQKEEMTRIPIWVKLHNVPIQVFEEDGGNKRRNNKKNAAGNTIPRGVLLRMVSSWETSLTSTKMLPRLIYDGGRYPEATSFEKFVSSSTPIRWSQLGQGTPAQRWKWTSNGSLCDKGSRIILGKNDNLVDVMIKAQTNQVHIEGYVMYRVVKRLKGLKSPFRKLLHNHGNLHDRVNKIRIELDEAQKAIDRDPSSSVLRWEIVSDSLISFNDGKSGSCAFLQHIAVPRAERGARAYGFTAAFFKKAWDVVGGDITCAIRDFFLQWPISCCNVLYKCISKIIANRVKEGLGDIVSINQSAFVPASTLRKVRNLDEFQYHHLCEQERIINLCFTDDLFLFARGHPSSCPVIMDALEEFKQVSGLVPSIPKSTAYFCNVPNAIKASILNSMPFAEGVLPVRYLGVPLISSRLLFHDCKILVEKLESRVNDWRNKFLSLASRLQLIWSILSSMYIYWSSVFILPSRIVNDLEQLMRGFLWCQREMKKGKAKVAWDSMCMPKHEGDLGIRRIEELYCL
ncbi:sodium/hydrogen exchanger 6 [Tanacetum coccineum]